MQVFYSLTAVTVAASATSPATSREDTSETPTSSSSSQPPAPQTAAAGFPLDAVYADPWVRQHVVLTYAPETTRDGLGAQAFRLLGIYALSKALGLQYLHTQPECVGHIGGLPHYQGKDCATRLTAADSRKLQRVQRLLALPSSPGVSEAAVRSWHVERLDNSVLTWELLRSATAAALQQQRPTLIKLARVQALLCQHPDVFLAVPQLQPAAGAGVVAGDEMTAAAGASGAASTTAAGDQQDGKVGHGKEGLKGGASLLDELTLVTTHTSSSNSSSSSSGMSECTGTQHGSTNPQEPTPNHTLHTTHCIHTAGASINTPAPASHHKAVAAGQQQCACGCAHAAGRHHTEPPPPEQSAAG